MKDDNRGFVMLINGYGRATNTAGSFQPPWLIIVVAISLIQQSIYIKA